MDDSIQKYATHPKVIGTTEKILKNPSLFRTSDFFVAIGNCILRKRLIEQLTQVGLNLPTFIHPSAQIASGVSMGAGTVVMANAVIQAGSQIGTGVIINTSATVDHDNTIDDFVHVAPGANLSGSVHVGAETWIGVGAVIRNEVDVCPRCLIGAGAVVVDHIQEPGTYIGVPAKIMGRDDRGAC